MSVGTFSLPALPYAYNVSILPATPRTSLGSIFVSIKIILTGHLPGP